MLHTTHDQQVFGGTATLHCLKYILVHNTQQPGFNVLKFCIKVARDDDFCCSSGGQAVVVGVRGVVRTKKVDINICSN